MSEEIVTNGTSLTIKGGAGYEAPWVVVRGSVEEIYGELQKLDGDESFLEAVTTVAATFQKLYVQATGAIPQAAPAQGSGAAPAAQQGGGWVPPNCAKDNCGKPLVFESWTNKDGSKTYGPAWRCTSRKFGHDVIWDKDEHGNAKPRR